MKKEQFLFLPNVGRLLGEIAIKLLTILRIGFILKKKSLCNVFLESAIQEKKYRASTPTITKTTLPQQIFCKKVFQVCRKSNTTS